MNRLTTYVILALAAALAGCGPTVIEGRPPEDGGTTQDAPWSSDTPSPTDRPPAWDTPQWVDVPNACTSTADCNAGMECLGGEGCAIPWTCQPALGRPCTADYAPFCGCDGNTFYGSSSCPDRPFARRGVCETDPPPPDGGPGACRLPDGRVCRVGEICTATECSVCVCAATGELRCSGTCVDAGPPPVGCRNNRDCPSGGVCSGPEGCGIPWTCRTGVTCTRDLGDYCACNGTTFQASSTCPGQPYAHRGRCGIVPPDAGPAGCALPDGRLCRVGEVCPIGECASCFCAASGELRCTMGCVDGGPPRICASDRDCTDGSQCFGPEGCGIPWTCQPPRPCTDDLAPFCGCDGVSFRGSSTCPGRPYAHRGACGIVPPDAGPGTCIIRGVTCQVGVSCHIDACTTCTCSSGGPTSCAITPGCSVDAGVVDAGVVDAGGPPPFCAAQDARGVGACAAFFGYAWDGTRCVGVGGCSCAGADCRGLPLDPVTCERNHAACPRPI